QACFLTAQGVVTDASLCTLCGKCAEACPTLAMEMSGRFWSTDELLKVIEKERPFFDQSGGGVTFSGGEPLLYPDFLVEVLEACGRQGIHRAVDTSGFVKQETLLRVAKHTDLFLYDLKMVDAKKHRQYTGSDNPLILTNLQALAESGAAIQIRIPLIGGVNDDDGSVVASAVFVAGLSGEKKRVNLLPFHDVARGKDQKLGQQRDLNGLSAPTQVDLERVIDRFAEHGLVASVGG
ncbi:MAG: glycyl-radical enzyme activating protein, partial [Desulfuromonadales bacterium]|nr:glycyl-radical enzyme activating protein [Desulfuromonadales bacterium]